jgi:hypothetical protein
VGFVACCGGLLWCMHDCHDVVGFLETGDWRGVWRRSELFAVDVTTKNRQEHSLFPRTVASRDTECDANIDKPTGEQHTQCVVSGPPWRPSS